MELARLWDFMARKTKTGREARCRHRALNSSQPTGISTLRRGWALGGLHLTCSREASKCWAVHAASHPAQLSFSSTLPSPFCLFQACCQGSSTSKEGGDMSRTAEFHQYTHTGHGRHPKIITDFSTNQVFLIRQTEAPIRTSAGIAYR